MFTIQIEAQTLPELHQKLNDLAQKLAPSTTYSAVTTAAVPVGSTLTVEPSAGSVTVAKPKKKKEAQSISLEDLRALCVKVGSIVNSQAVKALVTAYGVANVNELTDEQRDDLAAKLRDCHE